LAYSLTILFRANLSQNLNEMAHFGRFRLPLAVVVGRRLATVGDSHPEFVRDFNADFP